MPAWRLTNQAIAVRRCDAVGCDSPRVPEFIRHVALSDEERPGVSFGMPISVVHMGPPLESGTRECSVHALGTARLTWDEEQQIRFFVAQLEGEYEAHNVRGQAAKQYVIHPHVRDEHAPDGTVVFRRFSCAGFVLEAYRFAGIGLLCADDPQLPTVAFETLTCAYPEWARQLEIPRLRERFGLEGTGPWPVVLAGYVLNALTREADEIRRGPYTPIPGDEYFPTRRRAVSP